MRMGVFIGKMLSIAKGRPLVFTGFLVFGIVPEHLRNYSLVFMELVVVC